MDGPIKDGEFAEPSYSDPPDRRGDLADAATQMGSIAFIIHDIRIRCFCQRCTGVLYIYLEHL